MTTAKPPQPHHLPRLDHVGPLPDSRGLVLAPDPDRDLAWVRGRHSLVSVPGGGYAAGETEPQRHCGWCGASDMEARLRVAQSDAHPDGPLTRCKNLAECHERYLVRETARREAEAAKAAEAAKPKPAPRAPRKPRTRPSTARAKTAAKTAKAAPEDATEPPEGAA